MSNVGQPPAVSQVFDSAGSSDRPDSGEGLLLVGHGTRDAQGVAEFFETAGQVARLSPGQAVEPCFLELAEPTIAGGVARLADRGVRRIVVVPVLLFSAGHDQRDIPAAVAAACQRYPDIRRRQTPPLGCHRRIVDLSQRRFDQIVARAEVPLSVGATWLILVGRGSHDAGATAEMRRFAALRGERTPGVRVRTCFYAMAEPSLDETLRNVASAAASKNENHRMKRPTSQRNPLQIIVQPHLLYHGQLASKVRRQVAMIAQETDDLRWSVTEHLGPDLAVAEAIVDIANRHVVQRPAR